MRILIDSYQPKARPQSLSALEQSAAAILNCQHKDGAIPWYVGGKLDPWDHTEAAMALSVAGHWRAAEKAYLWLARNQRPDGSWLAHYFVDAGKQSLRETNFVAYIATGVWHHYLITADRNFLEHLFPCITRAIEFVLHYQSEHGEIAWAVDERGNGEDDALVTACASILRSLDCACQMAHTLKQDCSAWREASQRLRTALLDKPERFDRTWPSKARFAMDWYYPILAGLYPEEQARQHLQQRWAEFVVPGLGCRCVNDEPWVTMAETSELVIACVAAGELKKAHALFATLDQWRDHDGGYWTGYVYRDKAIWPEEKTTWTAGAVILACDALQHLTPACELFTCSLALSEPLSSEVESRIIE